MRKIILVAIGVIIALLLAALYALVFVMASGANEFRFSVGIAEYEIRLANLAFSILMLLPIAGVAAWVFRLPARIADSGRRRRREKGLEALESALVSAAAGDGPSARRDARRAETLLDNAAGPRVIAAQSAEQMGDLIGAESTYAAMLADPRTDLVGRRGLAAAAISRRDFETAIVHASQAFASPTCPRWAFDLLFDAQTRGHKWDDAMETLSQGARRRHVPDLIARRRRTVLLTAAAAELERRDGAKARELAEQAASLSPGFAPGIALAARLIAKSGKTWRAASVIETAWAAQPHPALALAYRDLIADEPEATRDKRIDGLAQANPEHRESAILRAEHALDKGDPAAAREALQAVIDAEKPRTARISGLMARIAVSEGRMEEARALAREAAVAPGEADWSDLDPEGDAFSYSAQDWARLVYSYGDTGELIHPRHERYERGALAAPENLLLEGPTDTEEIVVEEQPDPLPRRTVYDPSRPPDDPGAE